MKKPKFVRTKDGRIIDLKDWVKIETTSIDANDQKVSQDICYQRSYFINDGDMCNYHTEYISHNSQVEKTADTIIELCDYETHYDNNGEFVIRPIKHVDWESLKRVIANEWFKDCKLAIKTDKGLIFVAELNKEGNVCLI